MLAQYFGHFFPIKDPVVIFAVVLLLILGTPILMGRFNLPGMIGLLLAGALLGPNGLGLLARDQSFILLGTVGLLYIMFTAALEVDLAVFKRYKLQGIVFGVLTFSLPQGIGTLGSYYLLGFDWPASILLASLCASHTLLAYPIVSRLGLSKNRAVTATIGGTMVTDTAALMVLAVIAGSTRGEVTDAFWWRLGISLMVFVSAILFGLPRVGRWFFRRMAKDGPGEFVFVLASVFLCAALSEVAGVEPIVGAFLAGIALNRLIPHTGALMNRIVFTGDAIFIPFFLLSVGMLLDARVVFGGARTWIIAGFMTALVCGTKYLAAEGTRMVFGYSVSEGRVMFGLSVAQAAATLAAVMVGHAIGLFDETVVNGAIIVILATCTLAPWVVARHGKKIAQAAAVSAEDEQEEQRILVPFSEARLAKASVDFALLLRGHGATPLYPLFVAQDVGDVTDRVLKGERMLSQVASMASSADVATHPLTRVDSNVGQAITRARKELRITDVIATWDGRVSSEDNVFGSVLDEILPDAGVTLSVTHQPQALNITTRVVLLVAPGIEEDETFIRGVSVSKRLASALGAPVVVMSASVDEKALIKRIKRIRPSTKVISKPMEKWGDLLSELEARLGKDDLVVLLGVRPQSPLFTPESATLPRKIATRFPDNNFVAVFASSLKLPDSAMKQPDEPEVVEQVLVKSERIVLGLEDLSIEKVLARIAAHARAEWPNDHPLDESAYPRMIERSREISPGVLLLRYQDRYLDEPSLWLGVSRVGVLETRWQSKGHLFFVLFGPDGRDSAEVSEILRRVRTLSSNPEVVDKIRFASDLKKAREALRVHGLASLED